MNLFAIARRLAAALAFRPALPCARWARDITSPVCPDCGWARACHPGAAAHPLAREENP